MAELQEKLEPDPDSDLYRLAPRYQALADEQLPLSCKGVVRFLVTGEISCIYKRDNRVRKVHAIVLLPSLQDAKRLNERLSKIGNIISDGRPILGLDPRILLQIMLEINPASMLIPAHIWTPWFSMLGAKSGFDSLEACFGEWSSHIAAVETGLSSDAPISHTDSQ
jgi:PHP family Zn ribbon phosphoesterase